VCIFIAANRNLRLWICVGCDNVAIEDNMTDNGDNDMRILTKFTISIFFFPFCIMCWPLSYILLYEIMIYPTKALSIIFP
jgi:hypothetical protein